MRQSVDQPPATVRPNNEHMPRTRIRILSSAVVGGAMALSTLIAYAAWLGWDQTKELGADGYLHGPYQWWQVAGLALMVLALAATGERLGHPVISAVMITAALTLAWSVDAATDPGMENDGLWPIGSVVIAVSSFAGVLLLSSAVKVWFRRRDAAVIDIH